MEDFTTKHLTELSKRFPTRISAKARITGLNGRLNLPKETEHFMSDLHGEAEAFTHIRRGASGVIKSKVRQLFADKLTEKESAELCTLIYYPEEKSRNMGLLEKESTGEYEKVLLNLAKICRFVGREHSIVDFRERIVGKVLNFEEEIEQIVWRDRDESDFFTQTYAKTTARVGAQEQFISALASAIRRLSIDRLHILGDIFDRGPRPDLIIDELIDEYSVDVQWGNHDVLWLGAAAGSEVCIATVLDNSITYNNLDVIEFGYGISLRPLVVFAERTYPDEGFCSRLLRRSEYGDSTKLNKELIGKMHKAIAVIRFKLEHQTVLRNPLFNMEDRLFLDPARMSDGRFFIQGQFRELDDGYFPTMDRSAPWRLSEEELRLINYFKEAFSRSFRLSEHARFLYRVGSLYKIYNDNLLFHGCIPLDEKGDFLPLDSADGLSGKALMDLCDKRAREGYFTKKGSPEKQRGEDFLWFLWCGKNSPLCGRERITSFERAFIDDPKLYEEPKNAYYKFWNDRDTVKKILWEFGLYSERSRIVNGHIPVNRGEDPIKCGGKLLVIDGGFCKAFHKVTGIAGYTLVYNAQGMRLSAHEPFLGKEDAIENNRDIASTTTVFEESKEMIRTRETDVGQEIREEILELITLIKGYESGRLTESPPPRY